MDSVILKLVQLQPLQLKVILLHQVQKVTSTAYTTRLTSSSTTKRLTTIILPYTLASTTKKLTRIKKQLSDAELIGRQNLLKKILK